MIRITHALLWVHDPDEALAFYTDKLGWEVRADVTVAEMGNYRWLTVGPAGQPDVAIVLNAIPGPPVMDAETAEEIRSLMAKGWAGTVFLTTDDSRPPTKSSPRAGSSSSSSLRSARTAATRPSATRRAITSGS
jgi:catechol 2,3-dioxygenase-like lactoylglutathione lyase family enzyme